MPVLAVALVVAVACGAVLRHVRRGSGGEEVVGVRRAWTQVVSFGFAASVSWSLFEIVLSGVGLVTGPTPDAPPPAAFGAIVGLSLYVHGRVLFLELAKWVFHWAVRAQERFDRTWRMEVRAIAWGVLAWPCIGALAMWLVSSSHRLSYLVIPLVVAMPLFYETWLQPWLQYWRSRSLGDTTHHELEEWLAEAALRYRLPRFHVRVHEGLEKNAFAMGGLLRHLVVIGGGLVEGMTTRQLQAVLAHEVAHVIRRDVLKLAATILAGGTCFVILHVEVVTPNVDRSTTLGTLLTYLWVGVGCPLFYAVAPGVVSRRLEYGADRLAVRLLTDGAPMIDALTRLHELRNTPLDRKSLTHPTGEQRIAAIRELIEAGVWPDAGGAGEGTVHRDPDERPAAGP